MLFHCRDCQRAGPYLCTDKYMTPLVHTRMHCLVSTHAILTARMDHHGKRHGLYPWQYACLRLSCLCGLASTCSNTIAFASDLLQPSLPCRSYRLRITAVRDPASANSVQLARLDLYLPLDPPTQPTLPLLGSVSMLQAAVRQAAEAGPGSVVAQALGTLLRVLSNIVQHPSESKHRTLRMENAKVKAMLSGHREILNLLRNIGNVLSGCIALHGPT